MILPIQSACADILVWTTLAPGLQYAQIKTISGFFSGVIYAFKINLNNYQLDLGLAYDMQRPLATVEQLAKASGAMIAVNGGFFTPTLQPVGLRVKQGKLRSPIKQISWWGVFYVDKHNHAHIVSQKQYDSSTGAQFAIQSGPRLVVHGQIPSLKPGVAYRTALGITRSGQVVIVATDNVLMTTDQLARIMSASEYAGGLNCVDALNLDGGSSTQMYAQVGNLNLNVPGFSPVADAVLVFQR